MARARQAGGMLLAVAGWTAKHRKRAQEFAKLPEGRGRSKDRKGVPPAAGQEERIRAHRARVELEDRGREWPQCWGCGARAPRQTFNASAGWYSRRVGLYGGATAIELHCPTCFHAHGWIETRKDTVDAEDD